MLNTGAHIPAIGLVFSILSGHSLPSSTRWLISLSPSQGTWQSKPNEVRDAVKVALQRGYRHIDTALAYGNEAEVGQGIKDSGVPREEIWITTKLDNTWHHRVDQGIASSLKDLGCGYVDLYLIVSILNRSSSEPECRLLTWDALLQHWPSSTDPKDTKKHLPDWDFVKTWYVLIPH